MKVWLDSDILCLQPLYRIISLSLKEKSNKEIKGKVEKSPGECIGTEYMKKVVNK